MCLGCRTTKARTKSEGDCMHLYNELVALDLAILAKYAETKDSKYLPVNKQLRIWISQLRVSCPPEEELNLIRQII